MCALTIKQNANSCALALVSLPIRFSSLDCDFVSNTMQQNYICFVEGHTWKNCWLLLMNVNHFYKLVSCHFTTDKTPLHFKDWDSGNTKSLRVYCSMGKDPEGVLQGTLSGTGSWGTRGRTDKKEFSVDSCIIKIWVFDTLVCSSASKWVFISMTIMV